MKTFSAVLLVGLLFAAPAAAQEPTALTVSSWSSGQRGELPLRIQFFSSKPDNLLDMETVERAGEVALVHSGLAPDVDVALAPISAEGVHLSVEVNVYAAGEVRFDARLVGGDGAPLKPCASAGQFKVSDPTTAALSVSHRLRSVAECAKRELSLKR